MFNPLKAENDPWQRSFCILVVSLAFHTAFVFVVSCFRMPPIEEHIHAFNNQVKIRIESRTQQSIGQRKKTKLKSAKKHTLTSRVPQTSITNHQGPAARKYVDLFPKQDADLQHLRNEESVKNENAAGAADPDGENDSTSFSTKVRHISKIASFANELANHISIPTALQKLHPRGSARLCFSRIGSSRWKVSEWDGDPYFRALLYEAIDAISQKNIGLIRLSESELNSVRIMFEYRTTSVVDTSSKPLEMRLDGNRIYFTITHQSVDPKWQMLTVSPDGKPALDLIGVGTVLVTPLVEKDPRNDFDVQRLR